MVLKPDTVSVSRILLAAAIVAPFLTIVSYIVTYSATITRIDYQLTALREVADASIKRIDNAIERMERSDRAQDQLIAAINSQVVHLSQKLDNEVSRQQEMNRNLMDYIRSSTLRGAPTSQPIPGQPFTPGNNR